MLATTRVVKRKRNNNKMHQCMDSDALTCDGAIVTVPLVAHDDAR